MSRISPSSYHHSRTALTGADQTITLDPPRKTIRAWLSPGSAPVYVALDGAANSDDPELSDSESYTRELTSPTAAIYIESTAAIGYINVEAC